MEFPKKRLSKTRIIGDALEVINAASIKERNDEGSILALRFFVTLF